MTAAKKTTPKNSGKETIYVDVDDEITHVIDKVKNSDHKIIALVLPKRATMLQSVVNMKLLKKAAQNSKKSIVLITSETGLLPLAGAAGLHVAKSLQSKPVIPPPPHSGNDDETEELAVDDTPALDKTASIGALATAAEKPEDDTETIELDNLQVDDAKEPVKTKASKKLKKLKVPNFERFRLGFVLAGLGLVLLIVGWVFAAIILPKATITIQTDTTSVVSSFDFTASTEQPELDVNDRKIPAVLKESKKNDMEKVPATGERDDGTKASGEVTLKLTNCSQDEVTVPAGTTVSSGGNNYITQESATLQRVLIGNTCSNSSFPNASTETVEVLSAENGDKYNIESGADFTVAGYGNVNAENEDDITGGTSKIVKIVSQKDIDDAVAKIKARLDGSASDELKSVLETEGKYPLEETLLTTEPKITASPEVNKEATEVTVTSEITYTMLGITREDLVEVISKDIEDEVDLQKQAITNDGIDSAVMRINNNTNPGQAFISFRTSVVAGPEINEDEIKQAAIGKKRGEVEQYVGSLPGVQDVIVEYSPFWVYSTPKAAKKITVVVEKPDNGQEQESSNNE